jgi:hypothetical protein
MPPIVSVTVWAPVLVTRAVVLSAARLTPSLVSSSAVTVTECSASTAPASMTAVTCTARSPLSTLTGRAKTSAR